MDTLYLGNTSVLSVTGLADQADIAVEQADVAATLYTYGGDEVSGMTWPVTLVHMNGGDYQGELAADLDVSAGDRLRLQVTAVSGSVHFEAWRDVYVSRREGGC